MLIKNAKSLKDYFLTFAERSFGSETIRTVFYGDYDRILSRMKESDFAYPALWVERPVINRIENGGRKKRFKFAISVLKNTGNITDEEEDDILDTMEALIGEILDTLEEESGEDTFEYDQTNDDIEFMSRIGGDLATGCRTELVFIGGYDCE